MGEQTNPGHDEDSLDLVERVIAMEEVLTNAEVAPGQAERLIREIESLIDQHSTPDEREMLIREIKARLVHGKFGNEGDFDDDASAALVRNLNPRDPSGQAGAAEQPEKPSSGK